MRRHEHTRLHGQKKPCRMNRAPLHGKCLKACHSPAFLRCDLAVKKPVRHFSYWKKVAAFSAPILHSLLASVQAALRRRRHCRLADDDYDKITFLFLAPAAKSKSNFAPSFLPFPLSLCISVEAAKVHQSQRNCRAAAGATQRQRLHPSFSILLPGKCTQPLAMAVI